MDSLLWWSLLFPVGFMLLIWGLGCQVKRSEWVPVEKQQEKLPHIDMAKV